MRVKDEDRRPKVYVACKFERKDAARAARDLLLANDCETVASWFNSKFGSDSEAPAKVRLEAAQQALKEIDNCDAFVILDAESSTGGLHFETAMALGSHKLVILIGKSTNIFHELTDVHKAPDLKSAIYLIKGWFARKEKFDC